MENKAPKVIAAHDLSGVGMASLSAAMPILTAMGATACPLPTAVLSTITGVFDGFTIVDLTEFMGKTVEHWESLGLEFDCIYSGFLGDPRQVDIIIDAASRFPGCKLVVDPVFADDGELYPTMTEKMVQSMRRLTAHADLITPNLTEAMYLLGEDKLPSGDSETKDWLKRLSDMGPKKVAITSARSDKNIAIAAYDRESGEYIRMSGEYIDVPVHGTGDVFTSVVVGALLRGDDFGSAISLAAKFIYKAIKATLECGTPLREGILISKVLPVLCEKANNICERF